MRKQTLIAGGRTNSITELQGDKMNNNDPFKQIRQMNAVSARLADQRRLDQRRADSYAATRRTTEATLQRVRQAEAQRQRDGLLKAKKGFGPGNKGSAGPKSVLVLLVILLFLFGVFGAFAFVVAGLQSSPF
jgi:hypothetical protein